MTCFTDAALPWPTAIAGPAAASVSEDGSTCDLNFAVRSRYAASVSLCLARQSKDTQSKVGYIEIALDPLVNKTGNDHIILHTPN